MEIVLPWPEGLEYQSKVNTVTNENKRECHKEFLRGRRTTKLPETRENVNWLATGFNLYLLGLGIGIF